MEDEHDGPLTSRLITMTPVTVRLLIIRFTAEIRMYPEWLMVRSGRMWMIIGPRIKRLNTPTSFLDQRDGRSRRCVCIACLIESYTSLIGQISNYINLQSYESQSPQF